VAWKLEDPAPLDSDGEWADAPLMRSTDEVWPDTHRVHSETLSEQSLALLDAQAKDLAHFIGLRQHGSSQN